MARSIYRDVRIFLIGATGGIGSATARRLRPRAEVILAGRNEDKLKSLAAELDSPHVVVNAADFDALDKAVQEFSPIDAIVNCAGSLLLKPAHLTTEREYRETIDFSLTTAFATVRAGAKAMMSTGGGSIVLCATAAARSGFANHEAIAAAKGGVMGLTLSAAATYAARNIRVNCVAPGLVETPLTARITGNEPARLASQAMHALGRIGKPDDVASAIAWLVDPENSWVTGQTLGVDGGLGTLRAK
jgi:NAD(P)-dependent dehydrogenase (short-subunit alcohol dehydrogenase family)